MSNNRDSFGNQCRVKEMGWQMLQHLTNPWQLRQKAQMHAKVLFAAFLRLLQILEVL